jgi:hypothetical protein
LRIARLLHEYDVGHDDLTISYRAGYIRRVIQSTRIQWIDCVKILRTAQYLGVFVPAAVPYRVAQDGAIDAIMQGAMIRFRTLRSSLAHPGMVGAIPRMGKRVATPVNDTSVGMIKAREHQMLAR